MHIILSGMIGAGKTTLSEKLSEKLDIPIYYEEVENNPYLKKLYSWEQTDKNRYPFLLQLYFLRHRFSMMKNAFRKKSSISDRSIHEDLIFVDYFLEKDILTKDEVDVYKSIFKEINDVLNDIKNKDEILIFLNSDFDFILNRIDKRGRKMEDINKNKDYFYDIWNIYQKWIKTFDKAKVLYINVDKFNFFDDNDINKIIEKLNILNKSDNKKMKIEI